MLALFLWMGWHEIAVPLAAIRHGADAVQLGMIKVVAVPVGIGLFGTRLVLGPRVEGLLQDDEGRRRAAPGLVEAVRAHFGHQVRERPVSRFQADLQAPINAPAVAKGYAQFAEWVYTR